MWIRKTKQRLRTQQDPEFTGSTPVPPILAMLVKRRNNSEQKYKLNNIKTETAMFGKDQYVDITHTSIKICIGL